MVNQISDVTVLKATSYAYAALLTLALYDYALCLAQEVETIWRKKLLSSAALLYSVLRYGGLLVSTMMFMNNLNDALPNNACDATYFVAETTSVILMAALQCAMIMRIHALYNSNKMILVSLTALFLMEMSAVVTLSVLVSPRQFTDTSVMDLSACVFAPLNLPSWVVSIHNTICLLTQTILLAATLYRFNIYRKDTNQRLGLKLWFKDDLAVIIARDNIIFYVVLSLPNIFSTIQWANITPIDEAPHVYISVFTALLPLCTAVIGPRVILNVKGYNPHVKIFRGVLPTSHTSGTNSIELAVQVVIHREFATSL